MKKTSVIITVSLLIALIFVLAACGKNAKDDMKNDMTSMKNDVTSMMEGISSAVSGIDSNLTAEGNITKETGSTGVLEGMTSDEATTEKSTSSTTSQSFATTSEAANP